MKKKEQEQRNQFTAQCCSNWLCAVSFIEGGFKGGNCLPMHGEDITEIGQKCFTLQAIYRKIGKVLKDLVFRKRSPLNWKSKIIFYNRIDDIGQQSLLCSQSNMNNEFARKL